MNEVDAERGRVYLVVLRGCEAERDEDVNHCETHACVLRNGRIIKELEDFLVCKFYHGSPSTLGTNLACEKVFSQDQKSLFSTRDPKKIAPRKLVPALQAWTPSCASSDTRSRR